MPIESTNNRLAPSDSDFAGHVEAQLSTLLEIISTAEEKINGVPQGYTYLGQLMAHDIAPRPGVNTRTWKFDLDSIYPPFEQADKVDPNSGKFRYKIETPSLLADFLRNTSTKKALIPEFRNDDQLIIAQLHLSILFFHNIIVDELISHPAPASMSKDVLYYLVRDYVRACMHRIAMEDYLKVVCDDVVYSALGKGDKPTIINIKNSEAGLPFEITHAAGRFGHSMVRSKYDLNTTNGVGNKFSLLQLFLHTGEHNPLYNGTPKSMKLDWSIFFHHSRARSLGLAAPINPAIVPPMTMPPNPNIVQVNLEAGIRKSLSSGQDIAALVAKELLHQGIDEKGIPGPLGITPNLVVENRNTLFRDRLNSINLWEKMPLWLFILVEADNFNGGRKLGPLGSLLTLEVAKNTIRIPGVNSYETVQKQFEDDFALTEIRNMYDLLKQI